MNTTAKNGEFVILGNPDRDKQHQYLQFSKVPITGRIPYATLLLIETYITSKVQTAKKWKNDKSMKVVHWEKEGKKIDSAPINYSIILNNIKSNGYFNPHILKLPVINETWLDVSVACVMTTHYVLENGQPSHNLSIANHELYLGSEFPISPNISREGLIVGSFLDSFLNRLMVKRNLLAENSRNFYSFEWLLDFKDWITDVISTVEIALHLLYNKAEFDPLPNWIFDKGRLGLKNGRRFKDKLKWVNQISGNSFNIEEHKSSLIALKDLRNHLNHFDPPCFCITIEECCKYLNSIYDVVLFHIKMRKALNLKVSITLANMLVHPHIVFVPENEFKERAALNHNHEGYYTSNWSDS